MDKALAEAEKAWTKGEVPVGAVVADPQGRLIGMGHNEPIRRLDPSAHAEMLALRTAAQTVGNYRLDGCVLVVTLEPCLMCTGAIVHSRLAGVVYGAADSKAGAVVSCFNGLDLPFLNHRVWHMGGISAAPCADILRAFFQQAR